MFFFSGCFCVFERPSGRARLFVEAAPGLLNRHNADDARDSGLSAALFGVAPEHERFTHVRLDTRATHVVFPLLKTATPSRVLGPTALVGFYV